MPAATPTQSASLTRTPGPFHGLEHDSFGDHDALAQYDPRPALHGATEYAIGYMPDEVTRDFGRRMHYAAYRARRAVRVRDRNFWQTVYYQLRDRIVLGNQKLVYKSVRYRKAWALRSDDLIGEGHVVLINAVERYNPWLGVRFSTYAFTCLIRALVRLTRKRIGLEQRFQTYGTMSSETTPLGAVPEVRGNDLPCDIDHYFQTSHPLLSDREKLVLQLRFGLGEQIEALKLELIGQRLGLSKERIRQVQVSALTKLREAVAVGTAE